MSVAIYYDSQCLQHETGRHPESKERLTATMGALREAGLLDKVQLRRAEAATFEDLRGVHTAEYIGEVQRLVASGARRLDADTVISPGSLDAALAAAGGALAAVGAVVEGSADKSFALVRPPGHHACPDRGMGFCLFNNVAIAVRSAQRRLGVKRILIVDFDVHHGNGTQQTFEDEPDVVYFSTHEYPFYPGTGGLDETGVGQGTGATVNVPLPAGVGDLGYRRVFADVLQPVARRFKPELIVVSAGYDGHWRDPIGAMNLSIAGFAEMADCLVALSAELCAGRLAFVLEGGYALDALAGAVAATIQVMIGEAYRDPLGPGQADEPEIASVIDRIKRIHHL